MDFCCDDVGTVSLGSQDGKSRVQCDHITNSLQPTFPSKWKVISRKKVDFDFMRPESDGFQFDQCRPAIEPTWPVQASRDGTGYRCHVRRNFTIGGELLLLPTPDISPDGAFLKCHLPSTRPHPLFAGLLTSWTLSLHNQLACSMNNRLFPCTCFARSGFSGHPRKVGGEPIRVGALSAGGRVRVGLGRVGFRAGRVCLRLDVEWPESNRQFCH
ncbi:unnamed protein product [Protopolystoma xenopodis]|uniref:Uncharacterized protein n=1 Tax=Protopolystoma xenopodis TaxID=117903 RepID=A0A448WKE7_9PLAT|nr:unnamed protein product [Protopolystoma xenopodis]